MARLFNLFIICAISSLLSGCGIKHRVYTIWENEETEKFRQDNYNCMRDGKHEHDQSRNAWTAGYTELMFIDSANDISIKKGIMQYYKCMDAYGNKIREQLVSVKGEEISAFKKSIESCRHLKNESDGKKCIAKQGWYLIGKEPWIYEYDDMDDVMEKAEGRFRKTSIDSVTKDSSGDLSIDTNIEGIWKGEYKSKRGKQIATLSFSQHGGYVTGTFASTTGARGDIEGTMAEDTAEFTIKITTPGCSGTFRGTAKVAANEILFAYAGEANPQCGGHEEGTGRLSKVK